MLPGKRRWLRIAAAPPFKVACLCQLNSPGLEEEALLPRHKPGSAMLDGIVVQITGSLEHRIFTIEKPAHSGLPREPISDIQWIEEWAEMKCRRSSLTGAIRSWFSSGL